MKKQIEDREFLLYNREENQNLDLSTDTDQNTSQEN